MRPAVPVSVRISFYFTDFIVCHYYSREKKKILKNKLKKFGWAALVSVRITQILMIIVKITYRPTSLSNFNNVELVG